MRKKDRNKIVEPDYTIYEVKPNKGDERKLSSKRMERRGLASENKSKKGRVPKYGPSILGILFVLGAIGGLIYVIVTADWNARGMSAVFLFCLFAAAVFILSNK